MAKPKQTAKQNKTPADEKLDTMLDQAAEIYSEKTPADLRAEKHPEPEELQVQDFPESMKAEEEFADGLDGLVGTTIACPQHGEDYQITIQQESIEGGYKLFAVCNCAVRNNMWRKKVVWEKTINIPLAGNSTVSNTEGV